MQFHILQTFSNYIETHIVVGRFEEAGINCWLKDENTVTIDPILTNVIGGIKLMVADTDLEKATAIMSTLQQEQRANYACPHCSSHNIEYITTPRKAVNWLSAIGGFLSGNFAMGAAQTWRCFNCEKEFSTPVDLSPAPPSFEN